MKVADASREEVRPETVRAAGPLRKAGDFALA
jgi:hypothetical protein